MQSVVSRRHCYICICLNIILMMHCTSKTTLEHGYQPVKLARWITPVGVVHNQCTPITQEIKFSSSSHFSLCSLFFPKIRWSIQATAVQHYEFRSGRPTHDSIPPRSGPHKLKPHLWASSPTAGALPTSCAIVVPPTCTSSQEYETWGPERGRKRGATPYWWEGGGEGGR